MQGPDLLSTSSSSPMNAPVGQVEIAGEEGTKKAKINKAQQYMFFAVLGASLVFGVTVVVSIFLLRYINFNTRVISAKDAAIEDYSKAILDTGTCKKPRGEVYTIDELKACNPNDIDASSVPGSLRYNVLMNVTGNVDLESVARESVAICYDEKGSLYTYAYLREKYEEAKDENLRKYYLGLIKMCSSLRVIPDALPSVKNEAAMMSSVGQVFKVSNVQQDSLAPGSGGGMSGVAGVNIMSVGLEITNEANTTREILANFEKSIRNFDINAASIQWRGDRLTLGVQMSAYYTSRTELKEKTVTINPEEKEKAKENTKEKSKK